MAQKAKLNDLSKCIACRGCQVACKSWNQLPAADTQFVGTYENPPDLLPETWCRIKYREVEEGGKVRWLFCFYACMHCHEPGCAKVCPVNAISKTSLGAVVVDQDTCISCGLCVTACPFDVPRVGSGMVKCTLCHDRISNGLVTACAKACPTRSICFGDRDDMVAQAEARVTELKGMGFPGAKVYGQEEAGGTNMLYVLAYSPDKYDLPVNPEVSLSAYFWSAALRPVKVLAMAGLTIGFMHKFIEGKAVKGKRLKEQEENLVE